MPRFVGQFNFGNTLDGHKLTSSSSYLETWSAYLLIKGNSLEELKRMVDVV